MNGVYLQIHVLRGSADLGLGATSVGPVSIPLLFYKRLRAYDRKVALRKKKIRLLKQDKRRDIKEKGKRKLRTINRLRAFHLPLFCAKSEPVTPSSDLSLPT